MQKLQALTEYLLSQNLFDAEQLDSWADDGTLKNAFKETEQGLLIGYFEYQGVISIERYQKPATHMMAAVLAWLQVNDDERDELNPPSLEIEPDDDCRFDIDISVQFKEPVLLTPQADGPIDLFGKRYGFGEHDLWIAERVQVTHGGAAYRDAES